MKKRTLILVALLCCALVLSSCQCRHEWQEADCTTAKTCSLCNEAEGDPLGHDWSEATCASPATCTRCAAVGDTAHHTWADATCVTPKTCSVCGLAGNNLLADHQWEAATADTPKTCSVCGKQSGFSLNEDKENSYNRYLNDAEQLVKNGRFLEAIRLLDQTWEETGKQEFYNRACDYRFEFGRWNTSRLAAGENNSAALNSDGTVTVVGRNDNGELSASNWTNITAISLGDKHIVGLQADGRVIAAGSNASARSNVGSWENVVAISAGNSHTVALTGDGRVLATGYDEYGQCQVQTLMDAAKNTRILSVAAGYYHTAALLEDGTAVACGDSRFKACSVQSWTDLAAIYAGSMYTAGLKTDGTVVVTGQYVETWNTSQWTDIVNLAAGDSYLIGLKADGTVVSTGFNSDNLAQTHRPMDYWKDIVHISAGFDQTLAVTTSGEILCAGVNNFGQGDLGTSGSGAAAEQETPAALIVPDIDLSAIADHIVFDYEFSTLDEYANVVGMNAEEEPVWIYMTDRMGENESYFYYVEDIGQIGSLYFLREGSAITALNCATGQAVWQHKDIEGKYNDQKTDSDGNIHITGYSHDIYVTADGAISCASENGKCRQHSTVKPATPGKTAVEVRLDYFYQDGSERANIVGLDKKKNPVWIYRTGTDDLAQTPRIAEIGKYGNMYYFLDLGRVTALDIKTGTVLWQITDVHVGGNDSIIDTNGTIYLCGFFGPDFLAVNSKGEILAHIETFDEDYFWACGIEKKSGKIYVILSGNSSGTRYAYNAFAVNLKNYTYELIEDYPFGE